MIAYDCLGERRKEIIDRLRENYSYARKHSQGFVLRLFGLEKAISLINIEGFDYDSVAEKVSYGGFPYLAYLGFGIGATNLNDLNPTVADAFIAGFKRLQGKSQSSLQEFLSDDVAVLGVADGLAKLSCTRNMIGNTEANWLTNRAENFYSRNLWSNRFRDLAGDLLDERGRLLERIPEEDPVKVALELAARETWPYQFRKSIYPHQESRQMLLKRLLLDPIPDQGDLELLSIWLKALDLIIDESVQALVSSVSEVTHLLRRTQYSLKRWVWERTSRRVNADRTFWIIDNEAHVQSFLWAILYPIFGENLVDEQYLPGYGQVQPRFDLGITSLHLIIEVKVIRERGDFAKIEEEIAGDLGLYFKNTDQFNRMLVYVYDDCDTHYPERYDGLINSLKQRDRVEDVVIVQRPSMIPDRGKRKSESN